MLGSLKCDCADQLAMAMEYIQDNGPGAIIYLQQEGRGIGLANKIAAYAMQVGALGPSHACETLMDHQAAVYAVGHGDRAPLPVCQRCRAVASPCLVMCSIIVRDACLTCTWHAPPSCSCMAAECGWSGLDLMAGSDCIESSKMGTGSRPAAGIILASLAQASTLTGKRLRHCGCQPGAWAAR